MILVVDDNATNREILRHFLEILGFETDEAEDGQQALEFITSERYAYKAIFMDVMMPRLNGIDATKQIRKLNTALAAVPIYAVSGDVSNENRRNCLDAGMNAFVPKPLKISMLTELLEKED